jgi:hypothetical protein
MTILNGMMLLFGSLALAVPILLHLLMQPKPKPVVFPAIRFIVPHHRANRRQLRIKQWLLLFLRCLAIAAVAAALAQPSVASNLFGTWISLSGVVALGGIVAACLVAALFFMTPVSRLLVGLLGVALTAIAVAAAILAARVFQQNQPAMLGDRQAPVAAVIVVDTAPRMDYRIENQSLLDRARETAEWLIGQFPLASQVSVATGTGDEPFFSVDLNAAKKRLATLEIDCRDVSLPAAIGTSLELLRDAEPVRKEIYIVTDMSQASWSTRDPRLRQALADQPDVSLYVIDVGIEERRNLEVRPLELASSAITPSGELAIQATVEATGIAESRVLHMKLEKPDPTRPVRRDNKTLLPESFWERSVHVELSDTSSATVAFQFAQLPEGIHHGWIEIEGGDPLPIDDRRYFTIDVRPAWKTLVVHPDNVEPDNFIETVAPSRRREAGTADFACEALAQRELSSRSLADYRLVAWLDPEPVSDAVWSEFHKFVDQGGSLLIALGHNAAAGGVAHPSFQSATAQLVLPGEPTEVWRAPAGDLFISPIDYRHPILAAFRGRESTIRWNRLPVYFHWGVQRSAVATDEPADVVLRYSNRRPAVLEKRVGQGRVILLTTPITELPRPADHSSWNELFYGDEIWASWLLVLQTAQYLVHADAPSLNFEVEQTAVLSNDSRTQPSEYWLFSPRDEEPLKIAAEAGQLRYRFTDMPGHYRLRSTAGAVVPRGWSVNLRPGATRLNRIESAALDEILGHDRYRLARGQAEIQREQGVARIGQEFYPLLAVGVVAILGLEYLLATLFHRAPLAGASTAERAPAPRSAVAANRR